MINKISVIVITRNRAEMLLGCLSSIVNQTRMPDEVVVVDNASEDHTRKVILSFKKKLFLRYVYEAKVGIPYARNRGIKSSSGSIILMLDDDCEAEKDWVERMVKAHRRYPKAWVIQGRTYSLPPKSTYSLLAEFGRFLYLRASAKEATWNIKEFFSKGFRLEMEILMCDTRNFSIKTSYLKKYNLKFNENFYRGSDTDLGKQIIQKGGLIMFCPLIKVNHWERSTLAQFLEQRWQIGRTSARIGDKWKTSSFASNMPPRLKGTLNLFVLCKILNQKYKAPILMTLLLLDRFYRLSGWLYEKRIILLGKRV